jgi:hypothetical protein
VVKVFLTKVWGFNPEEYPVLGFNSEGGRRKFLRESGPSDWVVLAGTRDAPTPPEQRGRLLGRVQLGTQEINVEEILRWVGTQIPNEHYLEGGRYRWPYGLPMIAAERFPELPDVAQLFGSYLTGTHWASYAIDLEAAFGSEILKTIEALGAEPVGILEVPAIIRQRERQRALARNQSEGPTGPGPSDHRKGIVRNSGRAWAYLLKLEGGKDNVFKIGFSQDVESRLATLNKGLLSTLTGFSWRLVERLAFGSEEQAYKFEQEVHGRLQRFRVETELEVYLVNQQQIESAWREVFFEARWAAPMQVAEADTSPNSTASADRKVPLSAR